MIRVRIENVVASASLGEKLNLESISSAIDGAEYAPERFPGLIYRLADPKTAVLLFQSGKVVCTGAKSLKQVETTLRTVAARIRRTGQKVPNDLKIQVQNIVATADLGSELNLTAVAVSLGLDRVEYEPEQFPGLVCRIAEPRVVVLLFGSGRLVCTGARRPSDIPIALASIQEELWTAGLLPKDSPRAPPLEPGASRSLRPNAAVRGAPSPPVIPA